MKILKIVKTFVQWRVETAELDGIEQALAELREKLSQQSEALTAWLPEFGLEAAESTTMFRAEVREAGERLAALQEARKSVDDTEREVRHASDMASSLEEQITTLLDRLGAAGKSAADLEAWETELPRYSSLVQQRLSAETLLNVEKAKIESRPEVKAFDSQQIKDALLECEGAQKRIQDRIEGIEATKARVESIQEGTALADAIALKVEKEDELRDDYHDALESLAGYCLVDFLINESEGENSSWVFEQASAMLHRITGGKLSLHVQPSESGEEFVISDAVGDRRKLDALSVGERVQVLLAVRLAFLSMGETSALPIVVDEALGTADDDRAHEIIESLVNLAKGGRQVFYFTAQTDEVEKWRAVLDCQEGVTGTFIDLDHLRGLEANLTPQQTEAFIRRNTVPPPQDVTHAEYGERLGVKLPNARMFRIEALSIWAVLDDVDDVYHCWQRRIRTVGMLDENAKRGEQTGLDPAVLNLAIVRANALAAGLEEYWAGRARPLEIEDLIQSGAIKERWLEPLWDLAIDVDRDGAKLIESLTAGDLKRFRQDNTIALEASLRESGKIIEAEASTPDQVEAAVAAVFAREGIDPAGQMEWGLARLFQILGDYRKTGESDG